MTKTQFYLASCDRMGFTNSRCNDIARAFNKCACITSWVSPAPNMFLVKATEGTKASDIQSHILAAANVDTFVSNVDLEECSFSIMPENRKKTLDWIQRNL